jgi:hypothetical protein
MVGVGREVMEEVRQRSLRIDSSNRTGKMLSRIYGGALEGFSQLVRDCNLALSRKEKEKPDPEIEDASTETKQSTEALQIDIEEDDEEYALSVIESSLAEMNTAEIRELRDSCEEILGGGKQKAGCTRASTLTSGVTSTLRMGAWPSGKLARSFRPRKSIRSEDSSRT